MGLYNPRNKITDRRLRSRKVVASEMFFESEMFLFDPYKKCIQSNNETILDQGTRIKTSLVANIRAAYYIKNIFFSYHKLKIHNKVIHDHARMSL